MNRLLLLLGPSLALVGSLGLVLFGRTWVGVFEALTVRIGPGGLAPLPTALNDLPWAVLSAAALAVGLSVACVATAMRDSGPSPPASKWLSVAAGAAVVVGAAPLAWGIVGARRSFQIIATSAAAPRPQNIQEMIDSVDPTMTAGAAVLVLASLLLLGAAVLDLRTTRPSEAMTKRSPFGVVIAVGSMAIGAAVLLCLLLVWSYGAALGSVLANTAVTPKPAELAAHLSGVLNASLFAFLGLALQGLAQIVACLFGADPDERHHPQ